MMNCPQILAEFQNIEIEIITLEIVDQLTSDNFQFEIVFLIQ